jgi:alpha-tubulin suppressor-like RCC1 family protein
MLGLVAFTEDGSNSDRSGSDSEVESNDQYVVQYPTVITFPKFTEQIATMACGLSHCLAITSTMRLFSWGNGSYGALGFGSLEDQVEPRELVIW